MKNKKLLVLYFALCWSVVPLMAADAVFDFSMQGYENQEKLTTGIIDADNNTIWTASQGSGTIAPAYYNLGTALRIYGGGSLTISSDRIISQIILTLDITDKSTEFEQDATQQPDDYSFTFSRASGLGHTRIQKIEITYGQPPIYYMTVSEAMQVYNWLGLTAGNASLETYTVRGYVTKWKSGYPNYQNADFFIDDSATGSTILLECFRLIGETDSDKRTLQVGDLIEATAYFQNYNGRAELCNGTYTIISSTNPEPEPDPEPDPEPNSEPQCLFEELEGQKKNQLLASLHQIIKEHTVLSYNEVYAGISKIDIKADGTIWDMYSNCTFSDYDFCNNSNGKTEVECDCYNREHSLPKSWWGGSENEPMYTDIHHILPTDAATNLLRQADAYGMVTGTPDWSNSLGSKKGDTNTYTGGAYKKVFEPADQYKGDIARIYFYMLTCYLDKNFTQGGQGYRMFTYTDSKADFTTAACYLLLQWHHDDPVSAKEKERNDKIEALQGNRNPYVDEPNLVEFIWGKYKNKGYTCDIDNLNDNAVETISAGTMTNAQKVIQNGVFLIILPDGRTYNAQGQEVK